MASEDVSNSDHSPDGAFAAEVSSNGLLLRMTEDDSILPRYFKTEQQPPYPAEDHVVRVLLTYSFPVILALCTVGNLLTASGLHRMYPGVLSTAVYVFVALLLDTVVVWSRCGLEWLRLTVDLDLKDMLTSSSVVMCKIYPFLSTFIVHLDSWMIVAMAAETVFIYQRPQRLMRVCRMRRARLVIAVTAILLTAVSSQCFWTYSLHSPLRMMTSAPDDNDDDNNNNQADHPDACANFVVNGVGVGDAVQFDGGGVGSSRRNARRIVLMVVDLVVGDICPFFVVFSCSVMLLTKRIKRRDQVRQIDNTWKACNVDSTVAHQLHTTFIALCVLHTVLLFPKITFKSFLFVTDPHVAGVVQYSVAHASSTSTVKAVCYLSYYVYVAGKVVVFAATSSAFRGECRAVATCFRRPKIKGARLPADDVDAEGHMTSGGDHVTTGLPLLLAQQQQQLLLNSENSQDAKTFDATLTSAAILENGTPCIKIFSMTSV